TFLARARPVASAAADVVRIEIRTIDYRANTPLCRPGALTGRLFWRNRKSREQGKRFPGNVLICNVASALWANPAAFGILGVFRGNVVHRRHTEFFDRG